MRRLALAVSVVLPMLLAACGDRSTPSPTEPSASPSFSVATGSCPGGTVDAQIAAINSELAILYTSAAQLSGAQGKANAIGTKLKQGKTADAKQRAFDLINSLLADLAAGKLKGPPYPAPFTGFSSAAAVVSDLIGRIKCVAGISTSTLDLTGALTDGVVFVVGPNSPPTTQVTKNKFAGIFIPAGSAPVTTVIALTLLPNTPPPLITGLTQIPLFFDYSADPYVTFLQDVIVGICQQGTFSAETYARFRIAHNVPFPTPTGIEILPKVTPPFSSQLDCGSVPGASAIGGAAGDALRLLADLILPEKLSAAGTCCLGGSTKTFSPFGAVDLGAPDFGASAYSYFLTPTASGIPTGWQTFTYPVLASGWQQASAPFGSVVGSATSPSGCDDKATTNWPIGSNAAPSYILLRRDVFVPATANSATVTVQIDNDVQLWWNNTAQTASPVLHEGCAKVSPPAPFVVTTATGLVPGEVNKIAVMGIDRGVESYIDLKVQF